MNWKEMPQMDPSVVEAMEKIKEKLVLREPIIPEELYSLMEQGRARFPGGFKLKKGLFGASVVFDKHKGYGAKIKVKEAAVIIKRIDPSDNANTHKSGSIKQLVEVVKIAQMAVNSVNIGEIDEELMEGPNYFISICNVMRELLQSRMK